MAPGSTVTATITDQAGNTSDQSSQTVAGTDTLVNSPSITMESTGTDSVYNASELGDEGTITATIGLPNDAAAGDTLTVNGENQTLSADDISTGSVTQEVAPGSTVTATITDQAGNTSDQSSQTVAGTDTLVNSPSITMESTGSDSVYNASELGDDGTVTATIGLPNDATAGDILTVNGENQTLNADDISTGSVTQEVAPGSTVTATITDQAGNTSDQSSQNVAASDTSGIGTIVVNSITDDDIISASEAGGNVSVSGSVSGELAQFDNISFSVNNTDYSASVDDSGNWSTEVAGSDLAVDTTFTVTASGFDDAGNVISVTETSTHIVDDSAEAGTVSVDNITADDVISAEESGDTITVIGTAAGGDIASGDAVSFSVNGTDYSNTVDADGTFSADVAGSDLAADTSFDVNVSSSDALGNIVDTTGTSTHSVLITEVGTAEETTGNDTTTYNSDNDGVTQDGNLNGQGQSVTYELGGTTTTADIHIKSYKSSQDEGTIELSKDGVVVDTINMDDAIDYDNNTDHTFTITSDSSFDSIKMGVVPLNRRNSLPKIVRL